MNRKKRALACSVRNHGCLLKYRPRELANCSGQDEFERECDVAVLNVFLQAGDDVETDVFAFCGRELGEQWLERRSDFRKLCPFLFNGATPAEGYTHSLHDALPVRAALQV